MSKNDYLQKLKDSKTEVKVFLSNKTMLIGCVNGFDENTIIIDKCLIFNNQIISIVPA